MPVLRRAVGGGPRGEHDERERALQNRPEISADGGKGGAGGAGGAPASDKLDRYTTCIKFSPTGQMLALGSADRHIYLFNVESNSSSGYKRVATLRGHVAAIIALDWSADGRYLQSTCLSHEMIYWEVLPAPGAAGAEAGGGGGGGALVVGGGGAKGAPQWRPRQHKVPFELRDLEWADWTSTHGWPVHAIWPPYTGPNDVPDMHSLHLSHSHELCVASDGLRRPGPRG